MTAFERVLNTWDGIAQALMEIFPSTVLYIPVALVAHKRS
jgi:hypothetical protein